MTKSKKVTKGLGASSGVVRGPARVVLDLSDLKKVKDGDILIIRSSTPHIVSCLRLVRGIVTDMGGITSHAAIIAREAGLPCVVGTTNATRILKDGMLIFVNGYNGQIYRVNK